jgi:hypothetical protein
VCLKEEGLSFYSSRVVLIVETCSPLVRGALLPLVKVELPISSVGPCVPVLLVWRIVLPARHIGPCSESAADDFIVVHGGSHGLAS